MNKKLIRQEIRDGVAVFLANGGEIKQVSSRTARTKSVTQPKETKEVSIDMNALPKALKIRFGIKQ